MCGQGAPRHTYHTTTYETTCTTYTSPHPTHHPDHTTPHHTIHTTHLTPHHTTANTSHPTPHARWVKLPEKSAECNKHVDNTIAEIVTEISEAMEFYQNFPQGDSDL